MSRIPSHTIEDAPEAARPLLENLLQFSPTGKPLNLHAQMAFGCLGLSVFTSYFLNYADTEIDVLQAGVPAGTG